MTKVSTMIRQLAKEGHKLASLEKASVLSASDDPKDQDKAREIRVRHDYESLKKQIGSKKKPTKPAVNETTMPNVSSNDKKAIKARAKNLFKRDIKGEHDSVNEAVGAGVPLTPQELEIQKKMSRLNVRLARKRNQEMQKAKVQDTETAPEQVKEESAVLDANKELAGKPKPKRSLGKRVRRAVLLNMIKRGKSKEEIKYVMQGEEVELDERLGGKGYKPYTSLTGRRVSGDWENSDRGSGNKATRRAGGEVEAKSPTYLAHVKNKKKKEEEVVDEDTKRTTKGRWVDKKGRSHKFSVSTHTGDETHVSSIVKSQYPAKRVVITGQSADKKKKDTKKKGKKKEVKEDKAFSYVLGKLKDKYGSGVLTTGEKPKDTRSEKSKRKAIRKRAASDEKERRFKKRNPAVTSGRYPKDDEKAWAAAREREKREGIS